MFFFILEISFAFVEENYFKPVINLNNNGDIFHDKSNLNLIFQSNKNIIDIGIPLAKESEFYQLNNKIFQSQRSNFISILSILARL